MRFTKPEVWALVKSWIAISIAFGIVLSTDLRSMNFFVNTLIAAITVGIAFLLHELAHKYFAQKYHCWAEYRSFDFMLLIALITAFFGFILAAPGAVFIQGHITKKQQGITSAAGPTTNIILGILSLPLFFFTTGIIQHIATISLIINGILAVFNLLPIAIFDGKKVFAWNKAVWGVLFVSGLVLAAIGFLV